MVQRQNLPTVSRYLGFKHLENYKDHSEVIALLAVQSFARIQIHNAILFLNNTWYNNGHWLIRRPYLAMIASNVYSDLVYIFFRYKSIWIKNVQSNRSHVHFPKLDVITRYVASSLFEIIPQFNANRNYCPKGGRIRSVFLRCLCILKRPMNELLHTRHLLIQYEWQEANTVLIRLFCKK